MGKEMVPQASVDDPLALDPLVLGETCSLEIAVDKVFRWIIWRRRLRVYKQGNDQDGHANDGHSWQAQVEQ